MRHWSGWSMLARSILVMSQSIQYLADLLRGQILVIPVADLHGRSRSAGAQTFSQTEAELPVCCSSADVNGQPPLYLVHTGVGAHQPARDIAADFKVVLAGRFLVQHRVEGCDAHHVGGGITHQTAYVFGHLIGNPSEFPLS